MKINTALFLTAFTLLCTLSFTVPSAAQIFLSVKPDVDQARAVKFEYNSTDYVFSDGLCALQKNQLWGFIDTTGTWVIEPQYSKWGNRVPFFSDGLCLVGIKAPDGYSNIPVYINKKGERMFKNLAIVEASPFSDGIAVVGKPTGPTKVTAYSYINTQGLPVAGGVVPKFKGWYFDFGPYGDGLTRMWDDKLSSYGFVDNKGKWAIAPQNRKWEDADRFSDGLCAVQNTVNFHWGYIDKSGAMRVPFDYANKPGRFSSGRALVTNDKYQTGYLGTNGNMVLLFKYTLNSFPFYNGFALVTLDNPQLTKVIINVNGDIVKQLDPYNDPYVNSDGTIVYEPKGQDGLRVLNPDGSVIIGDAYYQKIGPFGDNRAYVEFYKDGSQSGFINRKGELVIVRND